MRVQTRHRQASSRLTADEDNETLDHLLSLNCEKQKIGAARVGRNAEYLAFS